LNTSNYFIDTDGVSKTCREIDAHMSLELKIDNEGVFP
jgi:hypothetical protein